MVFRDIALFAQRLLAILPADYWWLLRCLFYAGYVSGVCHYPYSYTGSGDSTPLPDLQKRISTPSIFASIVPDGEGWQGLVELNCPYIPSGLGIVRMVACRGSKRCCSKSGHGGSSLERERERVEDQIMVW